MLILEIQYILESKDQIGITHILTMLNQNIFKQLFVSVNLYQHAKTNVVSMICFEKIIDLKILQFDWLGAF